MRRLLDRLVSGLLRLAPWYRPAEIEAREARTEAVHQRSIRARINTERTLAASYGRVKLPR